MNRKQRRVGGPARPPAAALVAAGEVHHRAGRLTEAEAAYRRAIAAAPENADARHHLGMALQDQGRLADAAAAHRQAISLRPGHADAHADLGHALMAQGLLEDAAGVYRQAAELRQGDAMTLSNLGVALWRMGRLDEAAGIFRQAIGIGPDQSEPYSNLGNVLLAQAKPEEAVAAYRRAISIKPGYALAHANLGAALQQLGAFEEAVAACRRAVSIDPNYAEAHSNLGNALQAQGKLREAAAAFRRAIALKPDHALAHSNLGNALRGDGRLKEAVAAYRQSIAIRPDYAPAHSNLGNALQDQGRLDEAAAAYRGALAIEPGYAEAHSNLLMCLHYAPGVSKAELFAEAVRFGRSHDAPAGSVTFGNVPDPGRRLRVGYVSADFRNHPVGYFLAHALASRDPAEAEIFCYANQAAEDGMTARLRAAADCWRGIVALSDGDAAAMIRADGIDILVDLAGHTASNRLPLFARRAAPVQVSWLGYFDTTGLSSVDYILADRFVAPDGDERYFTETVWRLPDSYLCYAPHEIAIGTAPPPSLASGVVTFGCFNNRAKITADTVRVWSGILHGLDGSRLLLKTRSLADAAVAETILGAFAAHGITRERLTLEGHSPLADMLAAYHRVDIALDPFPFGGGTTTAEALWMGVPVVSLRGDRWVGRISESILATVGLADLVAGDEDSYAGKALSLAADRDRLAGLHRELRDMMEASPFRNGSRFAAGLAVAYRGMWAAWCHRHGA